MKIIDLKNPILIFVYFYSLFWSLLNIELATVLAIASLVYVLSKGVLSNAEKAFVLFFIILNYAFNNYNFIPISGVDEQVFFYNVRFTDTFESLLLEIRELVNKFGFVSSRITFSAFLSFILLNEEFVIDPSIIVIVNSFFWFIGSHAYLKSMQEIGLTKGIKAGYLFLFMSPSVLYWVGNFGKDVIVVSCCMLAAASFFKKRYIIFILFVLLSLLFRPYSIIMVACFIIPLYFSFKYTAFLVLVVLTVFIYGTNALFFPFLNTFLGFVYFFISPNPSVLNNWLLISSSDSFVFSPIVMVIETIFISLLFSFAIFFKNFDKVKVVKLFLSIYCLSICLVGVGYINLSVNGTGMTIGNLGDNFIRKKLIVWPLLAVLLNVLYSKYGTNESSSHNKIS